ncbi:hypothetical protein CKO40_20075 [Halochromatium glycolicum]|uniref:Transposase n=2 Tax=Halochromatium glycolicum TaxID=85075 RepID=A0AAJ0XCE0_9GAMM|nr:hypothetical protein [Halochromatium glycolicum]
MLSGCLRVLTRLRYTRPMTSKTTNSPSASPKSDHDSPWKEALEHYFPEFLALLFPAIHAEIDWTQGCRFHVALNTSPKCL